jgi:hypothetical protein
MLGKVDTMAPATKARLKDLVDFLNTMTNESKKLWWVLTALRGPDTDSERQKSATTSVIRHAVGLREWVGNGATTNPDSHDALVHRTNSFSPNDYHFKLHAKKAFETLGLDWDRVNWTEFDKFPPYEVQYVMDKEPE